LLSQQFHYYIFNEALFTNFSLKIDPQQKIAIIGKSGSGKSTLIKILMGYIKIDDNSILIDNQDINKYSLNSLRRQISYIGQNIKLFNKSIYYNIQYGNNFTKNEINKLIEKYNLGIIFKNINNDFNINIGVNGELLSGGQKQIIQLLRIYKCNNKIIVLDEPTSALDIITKKIIIDIIKDISKNSTLIIITHDKSDLELVDSEFTI
jgi:ABC-type bacteriocin/lantibiotic exporter with double-glycine peptidase domain